MSRHSGMLPGWPGSAVLRNPGMGVVSGVHLRSPVRRPIVRPREGLARFQDDAYYFESWTTEHVIITDAASTSPAMSMN